MKRSLRAEHLRPNIENGKVSVDGFTVYKDFTPNLYRNHLSLNDED